MSSRTIEGLASTRNGYRLLEELEHDGRIAIAKDVPFFNEIYQILFEGKKLCETIGANNYLLETLFSLAGVRFIAYKRFTSNFSV